MPEWLNVSNGALCYKEFHKSRLSICPGMRAKIGAKVLYRCSRRKASPMAGGNGSSGIAVVGAGVAGLHLALLLQKQGIPATLYSDKTAAQLASGRMLNTVAHHNTTVKREQALGVDHWDLAEYGYFCHHHYIGGPGLSFPGAFSAPSRAIDYRVYLPRLLADFESRGGEFRAGASISPEERERLAHILDDHVQTSFSRR